MFVGVRAHRLACHIAATAVDAWQWMEVRLCWDAPEVGVCYLGHNTLYHTMHKRLVTCCTHRAYLEVG